MMQTRDYWHHLLRLSSSSKYRYPAAKARNTKQLLSISRSATRRAITVQQSHQSKTRTASTSFLFLLTTIFIIMRQDRDPMQPQRCQALALAHSHKSSSAHRIISRKDDGQFSAYVLDTTLSGKECDALLSGGEREAVVFSRPSSSSVLNRFRYALRSTFLPSLPSDGPQIGTDCNDARINNYQLETLRSTNYLRYIFFDNIQDFSTSLRSVLATQRILHGVGVGRSGATALSATLNFLIRDFCGIAASLLFTSYVSRSFRRDVKRWKYFADIMVDFGITLEIMAPSVLTIPSMHGWFLPLLCLGNICKALCGVASGACGGALQMHWAVKIMGTEEGISEIAAKSGAQRTLVGGIGLVLSAFLAKWLDNGSISTAFGLYFILTAIHLISNYKALKLVTLDWLNGWRLHLLADECINYISNHEDFGAMVVSSPADVSERESLLFFSEMLSIKRMHSIPIRMGVSFNELSQLSYLPQSVLQSNVAKLLDQDTDNYFLSVGYTKMRFETKKSILISFFHKCSNVEKAKAYMHGCLVRRALVSLEANGKEEHHLMGDVEIVQKAENIARSDFVRVWPIFERCAANAGWKLDKTECPTEGFEVHFE